MILQLLCDGNYLYNYQLSKYINNVNINSKTFDLYRMKKRNWERVLMIYKKLELMIYTLSPFKSSTVVVGRNEESFLSGDESKRFDNKVVKKYQYICHVVDL